MSCRKCCVSTGHTAQPGWPGCHQQMEARFCSFLMLSFSPAASRWISVASSVVCEPPASSSFFFSSPANVTHSSLCLCMRA